MMKITQFYRIAKCNDCIKFKVLASLPFVMGAAISNVINFILPLQRWNIFV